MAKKFSKPELSRMINGDLAQPTTPIIEPKIRLDHQLTQLYPQFNRSTLQKFIKNGQVSVNGKIVIKANSLIVKNDTIVLSLKNPTPKPTLPIIYEDENVIVFNKPSGFLSISKGDFNPEPTLEDYGLIVHRLDRSTSGVIIVAKNSETRAYLQKQFQNRHAHKSYYAIVRGIPKPDHAIIDIPLARNLKKPTTFQPDPTGRSAVTEYQILGHSQNFALLLLKPRTGRTHQLRVHLSHIGTPILGDTVYDSQSKLPSHIADRLYLHAYQLEITIPEGRRKIFTAPLPPDFQSAIANLISPELSKNVF